MQPNTRTGGATRRRWAEWSTAATIATFAVVGATGVLMLAGIGEGAVRGPHEWVGLAFVVAAVVHTYRHWRSVLWYVRGQLLWISVAAVAAVTFALAVPGAFAGRGGGPHGMRGLIDAVAAAPIEEVAPIVGSTPEALMARLQAGGITVAGTQQSLQQVAQQSGRHLPEVLSLAIP